MTVIEELVIYHNPRCSKSRQTLELLQARGLQPRVVEYLKTPPEPAQLETILERLGLEPRELIRKSEALYTENRLDDPALERRQLIEAMVRHPILIERPIVLAKGRAALGRPPEKVLEILDDA